MFIKEGQESWAILLPGFPQPSSSRFVNQVFFIV
jgi:hypothetical protein